MRILCLVVLLGIQVLVSATEARPSDGYTSLREALFSQQRLAGRSGPEDVQWLHNGNQFSFLRYNVSHQLTEILMYDPDLRTEQVLLGREILHPRGQASPLLVESHQWSRDNSRLLLQSNFRPQFRHSGISDYYIFTIGRTTPTLVAKDAGSAQFSPNGSMVAFERDGNLFLYDISSAQTTQITNDASEFRTNGRLGWVYEEEFMISKAWRWSPDSRYIAYWQEDKSDVPAFAFTDFSGQHPTFYSLPYPKVGDTNPKVRIGLLHIATGKQEWITNFTQDDYYKPRIYWSSIPDHLVLLTLNRAQNHLTASLHNIRNGNRNILIEEKSDTWIDIFDFDEEIHDFFFFPEQSEYFFTLSDRDGFRHLYQYDYQGNLIQQVTKGNWDVTQVHLICSANNYVYYSSTQVSPKERHFYRIDWDGQNRIQLSRSTGVHQIQLSRNAQYYIDTYSNTATPRQVELWETNQDRIAVLEANYAVSDLISAIPYSPAEFFKVTTSTGIELDGLLLRPPNFNPNKTYPLILDVYGGPGSQSVRNEFETRGLYQYLAQQGFIIASVNNRGSGGYGKAFLKQVYEQLGLKEAQDFAETAQFLAQRSYIDAKKMAIVGHSYGGYMAALTMMLYPDVFRAGIATAPVTDWTLYNSIYTERYMNLIEKNPSGYRNSSVLTHAEHLKGSLLIVHSALDENVHLQHTMQLLTELTDHGIDAELRIFPKGRHNVFYHQNSYFLLMEIYSNFLKQEIGH